MKAIPLWLAAQWMGSACSSRRDISHVTIDSREAGPHSLFFALPGTRVDGHRFVDEVLALGGCAVVSEDVGSSSQVIKVDDTLQALQRLARCYLAEQQPLVVGITGSNGKTTTKDFTAAVLQGNYSVHATAGNYNTEIGLPLTILGMEEHHNALVLEMGMRGAGQIAALTAIAPLDVGVITNIGPVHLELLGSLDAVAAAKGEILTGIKSSGVAVLNGDDERVRAQWQLWGGHAVWASSFQDNQDVYASDLQIDPFGYPEFVVHYQGTSSPVKLSLPGRQNVSNAVLALAVGVVCGVPLEAGTHALAAASSSPMRMQIVRGQTGCVVINDAYNASPASMEAAIATAAQMQAAGAKIAVLGDMLELGDLAPSSHIEAGQQAAQVFDEIIFVGRFGGFFREGLLREGFSMDGFAWVNKTVDAMDWVQQRSKRGNLILLKASRGVGLEVLLPTLEGKVPDGK